MTSRKRGRCERAYYRLIVRIANAAPDTSIAKQEQWHIEAASLRAKLGIYQ